MTALSHNGIAVVADNPTKAPIVNRRTGDAIYWPQVRELTLDNGSVAYGCIHCDRSFERVTQVRPHLRVHSRREHAAVSDQERTITLLGRELDKAERKTARAVAGERAAKAETRRVQRELDAIRGLLSPRISSSR